MTFVDGPAGRVVPTVDDALLFAHDLPLHRSHQALGVQGCLRRMLTIKHLTSSMCP